ncbi:MAG: hypothetical protein AAGF88_05210 [Pseudomonadota bacterium]
MDGSFAFMTVCSVLGALVLFAILKPAVSKKLALRGHNPKLAYLLLVPVAYIGMLIWYVLAPNTPVDEDAS